MSTPAVAPPLHRQLAVLADVVQKVTRDGRSLSDLLPALDDAERPGVQALAFHVLRRWGAAQAARRALAPKAPPPRVDALLTSALALLWPDEAPPYTDHTLVDQAVTCARRLAPTSAGFVNAVLRRFLRERADCVAAVVQTPEGRTNHPGWWIDRLQRDWPEHWPVILQQAHRRPPMTLRVNARRGDADSYLQRLQAAGLEAERVDDPWIAGHALRLREPCPVQRLPGFAEGDCSVQDAAAQRAAPLLLSALPPVVGRLPRVLDACAAPGGKTAHLLEAAELELLALDVDGDRLARVDDTLRRLHLSAATRCGDASDPSAWWDGRAFDGILLDAPCSASGIVRRHPDIPWLRRPQDIEQLARIQARMLDALWPLLVPGGALLYATCSIFKAEGEQQVDAFLQRQAGTAQRIDVAGTGTLLPLLDNGPDPAPALNDGFFYALLRKVAP